MHVVTLLFDPYAQLRLVDLVLPFLGAYRPLWLGLGTLAVDVLRRAGRHQPAAAPARPARVPGVHWAAYAMWPLALLHALGTGTDAGTVWLRVVAVGCVLAVAAAVGWRSSPRSPSAAAPRPPQLPTRMAVHPMTVGPASPPPPAPAGCSPRPVPAGEHLAARAAARRVDLPDLVERAGLIGRGGAGFPSARKLRGVAQRGRAVVVGNGAEGEPASNKDRTLLLAAPAPRDRRAGAHRPRRRRQQAYLTTARPDRPAPPRAGRPARGAAAHRGRAGRGPFVSGEESALVTAVEGRPGALRPQRAVYERGVHRRPTLVQNVETLAHVALLARYGPAWFRSVGTAEEPGTFLSTVSGAVPSPGVYEAPFGRRWAACSRRPAGRPAPRRRCWSAATTAPGSRPAPWRAPGCRGPALAGHLVGEVRRDAGALDEAAAVPARGRRPRRRRPRRRAAPATRASSGLDTSACPGPRRRGSRRPAPPARRADDPPAAAQQAAPAACRTATSKTPGAGTAPLTVARKVPGSSAVPTDAEPVGAEAGQQRDVRERLDVVHQGRAAVHAALEDPHAAGRRGRRAGR